MQVKGQLFTMDLMVAILIATLTIGLLAQFYELNQRNAIQAAELQTNNAETIAESLINGEPISSAVEACSIQRDSSGNNFGDCSSFGIECRNHYVAKRLTKCGSKACVIEVMTCE